MDKVYCEHKWLKDSRVPECRICGEKWHKAKDKKPPRVVIGRIAPQVPPVFETPVRIDKLEIK